MNLTLTPHPPLEALIDSLKIQMNLTLTPHPPVDIDPLLDDDDLYYPISTRLIMTMIFSFLSIIGIVGNILVITVVLRVKGMITPTNCYLVSLAVADCLFFIATSPTELSYLHIASNEYLYGSIGCAIFSFTPYLAINCSSLSITAFTIERFIGICYPMRARYICTVKRAQLIIAIIWIFSLCYNSPWLFLATLKVTEEGAACNFKLERDNWIYKMMYMGDFLAFYSIPMLLNIIIYVKIAIALSKCGEKMKHTVKSAVGKADPTTASTKETKEFHVSGSRKSIKGRHQVVKMLAVVVVVFATCWLPYRAMVMHNSFFTGSKWDSEGYIFFSKTMIFINCAINPILYNVMSLKFRSAFRKLLSGKRSRAYTSPKNEPSGISQKQLSDDVVRLIPTKTGSV